MHILFLLKTSHFASRDRDMCITSTKISNNDIAIMLHTYFANLGAKGEQRNKMVHRVESLSYNYILYL